jgi:hypothetical protein
MRNVSFMVCSGAVREQQHTTPTARPWIRVNPQEWCSLNFDGIHSHPKWGVILSGAVLQAEGRISARPVAPSNCTLAVPQRTIRLFVSCRR